MNQLKTNSIYKHFKGNKYLLLYIAHHSETMEEMVVYQALYGDKGIWVRPLPMWIEKVEVDGIMMDRFALIEE